MLTVFIVHRGRVIYIHPFKDHEEAIEHFSRIQVDAWLDDDVELGLTNDEVVPLGELPPPPFYVR